MESTNYQTASDTLALLEERLLRIDYIIHGDSSSRSTPSDSNTNRPTLSATERLRKLERNLASLTTKSSTVSDVLALQRQHPTIFQPQTTNTVPPLVPPALAALILAHAPLFQQSSTALQTLQSQSSIPDPGTLAKLVASQPRLDRVRAKQDEQAREFAELRVRSARVVEKWYEDGVLRMGEKWAGWEERLRESEILVRRVEARERREREGLV